jgi:hypothetical protein
MQRRAQLMMSGSPVALILLAAGGLWFLSIERRYQQRIYPNIFVLGVNVVDCKSMKPNKHCILTFGRSLMSL